VLCVRRFVGSHTYLTIAEKLSTIFEEFKVPVEKIVRITTDNDSNFAKAFNLFSKDQEEDNVDIYKADNEDESRLKIIL
jgi:hypothetical protein